MSEDGAQVGYAEGMQAQPSQTGVRAGHPRIQKSLPDNGWPDREAAHYRQPGARDKRWKRNQSSPPKSRLGGCATWYDPLLEMK